MNSNIGLLSQGVISWDGTNTFAYDTRFHNTFGWTFEVTADLANDTVFLIETAAPDPADPCNPGAFEALEEVAICSSPSTGSGAQASVTLPAGTPAGTICAGTVPCRGLGFMRLVADSGDTGDVRAVLIRHGSRK